MVILDLAKEQITLQTNRIITSPSTHYRQQRANIILHSFLDISFYFLIRNAIHDHIFSK